MASLFFSGTRVPVEGVENGGIYLEVRASSDVPFNAVQGSLLVPGDVVSVERITTGGSIVALWPESPKLADGRITFSGVIPGGYEGESGLLFGVTLIPNPKGTYDHLVFEDVAMLANDGYGTPLPVTLETTSLAAFPTSVVLGEGQVRDTTPPEPFTPVIAKEKELFGGKHTLLFSTTDQGSGVDHYEVLEFGTTGGPDGTQWQRAESPYLLRDQGLASSIYVRAVDRAGNFIVVTAKEAPPAGDYLSVFLGFVVVLLLIWIAKRWFRRGAL